MTDYEDTQENHNFIAYITGDSYSDRVVKPIWRKNESLINFWRERLYGKNDWEYTVPCADYLHEYIVERKGMLRWMGDDVRCFILDGRTDGWTRAGLRRYFSEWVVNRYYVRKLYVLAMVIERGDEIRGAGRQRLCPEEMRDCDRAWAIAGKMRDW